VERRTRILLLQEKFLPQQLGQEILSEIGEEYSCLGEGSAIDREYEHNAHHVD
jgi:hypothetical protein